MKISVSRLGALVEATFAAAGCDPEESRAVAAGLVDANLTGHDSHGVARVPRYIGWLRSGEVEAGRTIEVVSDHGSLAVLDGHYGFGATVGREAVAFGVEKARGLGVAIVALRHAGHLGRIGQWAETALASGLVSLHIVNVAGSTLVAPFGGVERRFSTAPIAFGFPVPDAPPIVLDFATSAVAEGKVLVAANGGKPLPPGSLIASDGELSADPDTLYGRGGAIRAMGDHKGSGLALMCELLAGALTGSGCSGPAPQRFANGMVSIYMSPEMFGSQDSLARDTRDFVNWMRATRPAVTGGRVLLPGDPERTIRAEREADGIPLTADIWSSLVETAKLVGVDPTLLQA